MGGGRNGIRRKWGIETVRQALYNEREEIGREGEGV